MAPETEIQSDHPLFARVSAIRWYDQYYWPFALDQSAGAQADGYYDRLLVDRNRDGDMADDGELVQGRMSADGETLAFDVGELFFVDGKREDPRFTVTEMTVTAQAVADPVVQFSATMHHSMFSDLEYRLWGPFDQGMRFSADHTRMPTVNLTPEIVASPDFDGKEIQLSLENLDVPFRIGEDRHLSLVCLTGDPEKNDFVFALKNSSFQKPVLATLIYTDQEGETRGRDFEIEDWVGEFGFAGPISVPADAMPGEATLVVNFSERETGVARISSTHFTQVVRGSRSFVNEAGEEITPEGWEWKVRLVR